MVWRKPLQKALIGVIIAVTLTTSFVLLTFAAGPTYTAKAQSAGSYYTGTISFNGSSSRSNKGFYKGFSPRAANCLSIPFLNNTVTGTNNFSTSGTVHNGCGDSVDGTLTFTVTASCVSWKQAANGGADFSALSPGGTTGTLRDSGIAGCALCDTEGRFLAAPPITLTMTAQATGFLIHQGGNVYSNIVTGPSRQLQNSISFSRSLCPFG